MPKKLLYHDICQKIQEVGESQLLSTEYVNSNSLLTFKCKCGNIFQRTFTKYYLAHQYVCPECAKKRRVDKSRLSFEDVKTYISSKGCEYLLGEYKNYSSILTLKCACGNTFKKDFAHFKRGQNRCPKCGNKALKKAKMKYDYDTVKAILNKNGYTLLEDTYIDCQTPMKCQCQQGHIIFIKFSHFLVGHSGCKICANNNLKGEKHYNYKGGESEVIDYFRKHIKEWKKEVAKKYNYKCALTGSKTDCVVHHLTSFNTLIKEAAQEVGLPLLRKIGDYTKEQFALLEKAVLAKHTIDNGILLQRKVHNKFHNIYGKGNNSPEQFSDFVKNYYKDLVINA